VEFLQSKNSMLKIRKEADFQHFIFQKYASLWLEKMVLSHNFQGFSACERVFLLVCY